MNIEMMQTVRDTIARSRTKWVFDMATWLKTTNGEDYFVDDLGDFRESQQKIMEKSCGTVGCIAGWTVVTGAPLMDAVEYPDHMDISEAAAKLLDISDEDANYLFQGKWHPSGAGWLTPNLDNITKRQTLDYLDECLAAGEIVHRD